MKCIEILPLREQAKIRNRWLRDRLETILPELMDREGFDMWIVIAREYNEDPVVLSLLPEPKMAARRRTILVFYRRPGIAEPGQAVERLTISTGSVAAPGFYSQGWAKGEPDQWHALKQVVEDRDPSSIGINVSETFAFGDGLTYSEYLKLMEALGPKYFKRTRNAERLAVGWLERRSLDEMRTYSGIVRICHQIVADAFSGKVVHPGVTTPADVAWWMRQRISDLGLTAWFPPSVDAQRCGVEDVDSDMPILPGDLLHCDVGFYYLGLASDIQQNAYVLRPGEENAPAGLVSALVVGNRMQDIVMSHICKGRTGNEILLKSVNEAEKSGIKGRVYCHPIGYHGHGAGPSIGLWAQQGRVPGSGDYEAFEDTCHALELSILHEVPEWNGQEVCMALEEDILYTDGKVYLLDGRQEQLHLI
ncbi:MAG: M24 family metallopeptidase [Bacillota bacterium]